MVIVLTAHCSGVTRFFLGGEMPRAIFKMPRIFFPGIQGCIQGAGRWGCGFTWLWTDKWTWADVMTFFALHLILGEKRK